MGMAYMQTLDEGWLERVEKANREYQQARGSWYRDAQISGLTIPDRPSPPKEPCE